MEGGRSTHFLLVLSALGICPCTFSVLASPRYSIVHCFLSIHLTLALPLSCFLYWGEESLVFPFSSVVYRYCSLSPSILLLFSLTLVLYSPALSLCHSHSPSLPRSLLRLSLLFNIALYISHHALSPSISLSFPLDIYLSLFSVRGGERLRTRVRDK